MTRRDYSDATLDALAERRAQPDERSLADMLSVHRRMYAGDLWLTRLTSDEPAVFIQYGARVSDPMSMLGPTLSYMMERYLTESYGELFPWARALRGLRVDCRRHHPEHAEREEFDGSLCHKLVSLTIIGGYELDATCLQIGLTPERAGRRLRMALRWIEAYMRQRLAIQQARNVDAGYQWPPPPTHVHRPLPGLHMSECHNLTCKRRRAA